MNRAEIPEDAGIALTMSYTQRISLAWVSSLLLHSVLLAVAGTHYVGFGPSAAVPPKPILVNLQPKQHIARQLVDVRTPAAAPVEQTDLIAEVDSNASGKIVQAGDNPGPVLDRKDDFNTLAAIPPPLQPRPRPVADSTPSPMKQPNAPENKKARPPKKEKQARAVLPPAPAPPEVPGDKEADRFDLAKAEPPPPPERPQGASKGRLHNEVKREGFTNFEAMRDQIAPYLREIRKQVEKRWIEGLLTRYSGTQPTKVTIDCAINPEGTLLSASIVGAPDDRLYAALCLQALQNAGPFGPFPFKVPDLYRNRNLEIRWTFSFLDK